MAIGNRRRLRIAAALGGVALIAVGIFVATRSDDAGFRGRAAGVDRESPEPSNDPPRTDPASDGNGDANATPAEAWKVHGVIHLREATTQASKFSVTLLDEAAGRLRTWSAEVPASKAGESHSVSVSGEGTGRLFLQVQWRGKREDAGNPSGYAIEPGQSLDVGTIVLGDYGLWIRLEYPDGVPVPTTRVFASAKESGPWAQSISDARGECRYASWGHRFAHVRIPATSKHGGAPTRKVECFATLEKPAVIVLHRPPELVIKARIAALNNKTMVLPVTMRYEGIGARRGHSAEFWSAEGLFQLGAGRYRVTCSFGSRALPIETPEREVTIPEKGRTEVVVDVVTPSEFGWVEVRAPRFRNDSSPQTGVLRLSTESEGRETLVDAAFPLRGLSTVLPVRAGRYVVRAAVFAEDRVHLTTALPKFRVGAGERTLVNLSLQPGCEVRFEPNAVRAAIRKRSGDKVKESDPIAGAWVDRDGAPLFAVWAPAFPSSMNAVFRSEVRLPRRTVATTRGYHYWVAAGVSRLRWRAPEFEARSELRAIPGRAVMVDSIVDEGPD